jgi:hypothetical protein
LDRLHFFAPIDGGKIQPPEFPQLPMRQYVAVPGISRQNAEHPHESPSVTGLCLLAIRAGAGA